MGDNTLVGSVGNVGANRQVYRQVYRQIMKAGYALGVHRLIDDIRYHLAVFQITLLILPIDFYHYPLLQCIGIIIWFPPTGYIAFLAFFKSKLIISNR